MEIGIYVNIHESGRRDKCYHKLFYATCSVCGAKVEKRLIDLKTSSKVCKHYTHTNERNIVENQIHNRRLNQILNGMLNRCYNKEDKSYRWYRAKGVRICNDWKNNRKNFEIWALNSGYKDDLTIDRIDENKDYCPENCRWISLSNNSKYKSSTSYINVDGVIHTGQDWARKLGFGQNMINTYIRKYGLDNTIEFIKRYQKTSTLIPKHKQSYYDLYMNQ